MYYDLNTQISDLDREIQLAEKQKNFSHPVSDHREMYVNKIEALKRRRGKLLNRQLREAVASHYMPRAASITYLANGEVCYTPPGFGGAL